MKHIIVKTENVEIKNKAKQLGLTLLEDIGKIEKVCIKNKVDEENVIKSAYNKPILIEFSEQKIIPLENIIATLKGKIKIFVKVESLEEIKPFMETLELGADGVVLSVKSDEELKQITNFIFQLPKLDLVEVEITNVRNLEMGDRVCVDTTIIMEEGEGFLVGSFSHGLLLVQAEVEQNPFVSPRPFRVNAGAAALYVLMPQGKTKYLSELEAGDEVLIVDRYGITKVGNVARSKIEKRPLLLIEAKSEGSIVKALLQNAETVKLVTSKGSITVTKLKPKDKVLAYFEKGGRHFGTKVADEMIIEK